MALATINLSIDTDLVNQIDYYANNESLTRNDLINNSVKIFLSRKQRLQELYLYGEKKAMENNITEEVIMEEIKKYRSGK
jgi:metal-responsive CopG/Arc/MetJ family transcriptional regulator